MPPSDCLSYFCLLFRSQWSLLLTLLNSWPAAFTPAAICHLVYIFLATIRYLTCERIPTLSMISTDIAALIGFACESVLYGKLTLYQPFSERLNRLGTFVVIFTLSLAFLSWRRRTHAMSWPMIFSTCLLFTLCTVHYALEFNHFYNRLVCSRSHVLIQVDLNLGSSSLWVYPGLEMRQSHSLSPISLSHWLTLSVILSYSTDAGWYGDKIHGSSSPHFLPL